MRRIALVSLLCLAVAGTAKGEDGDGGSGAGAPDTDDGAPRAPVEEVDYVLEPVDFDPFADEPPLHKAAQAGDIAAIEALLAGGADVNARDEDGVGVTPLLELPRFSGHLNIVRRRCPSPEGARCTVGRARPGVSRRLTR